MPGPRGAAAIMTTDTFPKLATAAGEDRRRHRHHQRHLQGLRHDRARHGDHAGLRRDRRRSIPAAGPAGRCWRAAPTAPSTAITVDGDTSTSDTLLLAATGQAGKHPKPKSAGDPAPEANSAPRSRTCSTDLAIQVVKDGEGAAKLVTIDVTGAATARAARRIGLAIANSPLVKTAIAGEDANWGRIVMAVGKSGEKADRDKLGDQDRRRHHRREGPAPARLRRNAGRRAHQGPGHPHRRRRRRRQGQRAGLDLRPDPSLYRDQCRLPILS